VLLGLVLSSAATASNFVVGDTVTATGTGAGQTLIVTPLTPPANNGDISPTISYSLGDSFNESGAVTTGTNFSISGTGGPWNFQDDFYFSTTGATIQTAVISNLFSNISDLQVRLIQAAGNPAPTIGTPVGATLVDSWQTFDLGLGGSYNETLPTGFAAGAYVLQIRGEAGADSSYGGSISFAPVPLPASVWLMLSGIGGLIAIAHRRKAAFS
jgi:hypothetical protein